MTRHFALIGALLLVAPAARADEPAPSPYRLRLDLDLSLLLGGAVLWAGTSFVGISVSGPWCGTVSTAACDPDSLNALDRPAVGLYDPRLITGANALLGLIPAALVALDVVDAGVRNWRSWMTDAVVILEAVAWDGAVQDLVRRAVRRPRPYLFTSDLNLGGRNGAEASFSFYSGHTSGLFAMVVATAYTYHLRHPHSKWRWLVWSGALAASSIEPLFRVLSGDHFPTDVLVGALAGTAFGLLLPALHRLGHVRLVPQVRSDQTTLSVAGRF